jgi:DNA-binding GntR family transcriptional regulator
MAIDAVLTSSVDPASDRPVYKQIADHLRAVVERGQLREGDQLPSEARLMEHYGVARMTIRNAMRLLQDEGLVTAEHGRGVCVRSRSPVRRLASQIEEADLDVLLDRVEHSANRCSPRRPSRSEARTWPTSSPPPTSA